MISSKDEKISITTDSPYIMEKDQLGKRIYAVSHLTGNYTLRSGKTSKEYFDKYMFESDPLLLTETAHYLAELVPEGTEVLAGLELGGIPIATALMLETGISAAFVRKKAKSYGTKNLAEGADIRGKNVCIIEDVTTTGGQIIESATELRKLGAVVENALCVIVRDEVAVNDLETEGIRLQYLFDNDNLE